MKNNRIPRKFNEIVGKILIGTNATEMNDIIRIQKNEYGDYIGTNERTGKKYSYFVSMLRNSEVFEILSIV